MKIAINALPFTTWQGIEIFLAGILQAWPNDANDEVVVFANSESAKFLQSIPTHIKVIEIPFSKLNKLNIFLHQQLIFPVLLKKHHIDILFCPSLMTPWIFKNKVVTIHDAAPFVIKEETSLLGKLFWKINLIPVKLWSKKIVTVSNFSKKELIEKLKIKKDKVAVIGVNALIAPVANDEIIHELLLTNMPYFISIGNARTRKNLPLLISAFQDFNKFHPQTKLVIVGKMDERMLTLKQNNGNNNILFTGFIDDSNKDSLISHATALVFPSYYEGFGIPIIEAQQLNTPVICSDIPVFREVAGSGAAFFDPRDKNSLLEKLQNISQDKNMRNILIQDGQANCARYSWDAVIEQLLRVIKNENTSS